MSGIIHKVKDALTGGHDTAHDSTTHNTSSTHRAGTAGTTGIHDTAGPHRSDVGNKLDPRVDSDRDGHSGLTGKGTTGGYGSHTTSGPHSSDMANKMDPRVDSDRDGSRGVGGGYSGAGTLGGAGTGLGHNTHGTHGTTGFGTTGLGSSHHTTTGPHSSDAANKLDPRVDSDRDGRSAFSSGTGPLGGTTGIHSVNDTYGKHDTHSHTHNTNPIVLNAGSGVGGLGHSSHGTHGTTGLGSHHTTAGPHSSDLANKADPRVDSDRDGRGLGHGTHGTTGDQGTTGFGSTGYGTGLGSSHHGTGIDSGHDGRSANAYGEPVDINDRRAHNQVGHMETLHTKGSSAAHGGTHHADPRFDSTAGSTTHHSGSTGAGGAGPAPNTAGPHKSDMMNKLDPRVDSDLDGSKTYGGNKTHETTTTSGHQ